MKKFILLIIVLGFAFNAHSQVKGLFTPVDQVVKQRALVRGDAEAKDQFLIRPAFSMTAFAIQFGGGEPKTYALNSLGLGLGYGRFTTVNDKAYCKYSVNLSLLTQVELSGVMSTQFGGSLTVDVFDKIIGLGVGYLDGHPMLLTTISYSF